MKYNYCIESFCYMYMYMYMYILTNDTFIHIVCCTCTCMNVYNSICVVTRMEIQCNNTTN